MLLKVIIFVLIATLLIALVVIAGRVIKKVWRWSIDILGTSVNILGYIITAVGYAAIAFVVFMLVGYLMDLDIYHTINDAILGWIQNI